MTLDLGNTNWMLRQKYSEQCKLMFTERLEDSLYKETLSKETETISYVQYF